MTHKVSRQRIDSKHEVVEPQDLDHRHYTHMTRVERVDSLEFHAHFKLVNARGCSRRVLKTKIKKKSKMNA